MTEPNPLTNPPAAPPQNPPATPPADNPPPQTPPGPVPYERFAEVNKARTEAEARLAKFEADQRAAQEKALADQNKWQELAEQRQKELDAERLRNSRQQVAMQKGIPADLVDRLVGSTPEELAADADRLLQFIKPPTGPGVPPTTRNPQPGTVDLSKMNPQQIRDYNKANIQ